MNASDAAKIESQINSLLDERRSLSAEKQSSLRTGEDWQRIWDRRSEINKNLQRLRSLLKAMDRINKIGVSRCVSHQETIEKYKNVKERHDGGVSKRQLGREYGVSATTINFWLKCAEKNSNLLDHEWQLAKDRRGVNL